MRAVGKPARLFREVSRGRSRFDFLARRRDGEEILVEVKSVTLVEGGVAYFPDAPTVRGRRHVEELEAHVRAGGAALVFFVLQRDDARVVRARKETDPRFALALKSAKRAGVLLRGARFRLGPSGRARYMGTVRVVP